MRKKMTSYYPKFIFLIAAIALLFLGFMEGDKRGNSSDKQYTLNKSQTSGKQGDAYRFNINNLNIPINRVGTIAAVNIPPDGTLGRFGNSSFLFSSGFFMSGLTNGTLWAFAQASASLIENMTAGTVASGPNDPDAVIYVVNGEDEPFGQSWQDWKDAVDKFDADFYDGDGDGEYNPVDLNGNGEWDSDEDMPDLLGDETAWCVYTDGQSGATRLRFAGINPQGIEVRQTVFGFASKGALGNMLFIRYRLRNAGLVADVLDSVYFGAWADPDLGAEHQDDLVGVDVPRNAGFTYNGAEIDPGGYEAQIPCFMIDFFSGPKAFIPGVTFVDNSGSGTYEPENGDIPLDTAFSFRGPNLGIAEFPGAKNLDVSSFVHYIQSDPGRGDPDDEFQARNYMLGTLQLGGEIDPCNDAWGDVFGMPCDDPSIDTKFWYSGDPVTGIGYLNTGLVDQRQMTNVGPFQLVKDEEDLEIVVAYVLGQGTDRLNSITVAREIDDGAQFIFDGNFRAPTPPPTLRVQTESGSDFIDFLMPVSDQVGFTDSTDAWDNKFHGINVTAYRTNSTQEIVGGTINTKFHTSYQADNFIQNIFKENPETGGRELLYSESANKLDVEVYSDPETGRLRVRVSRDPFDNTALIKGVPYYFAFTSYALNYAALLPMDENAEFGDEGDYFLSAAGFVGEVENIPKIITTVLADDLYDPPAPLGESDNIGPASGQVTYDVVNKSELTGDVYKVTFQIDSTSEDYATFWRLENFTTNTVLKDSATEYLFGSTLIDKELTDGFITKIEDIFPRIDSPYVAETINAWFNPATTDYYYVGSDLGEQSRTVPGGGNLLKGAVNEFTRGDQLKSVEIRFGETGKNKAFRYLMGYVGPVTPLRRRNYTYAAGVTTDNPGIVVDLDEVGKIGEGIVDVPFTAWVVDDFFGSPPVQLAVGFLELREAEGGTPDGVWDPGTNLHIGSGEYIFIFNVPYDDIMPSDPNDVVGLGRVHTGFQGAEITWANFVGYDIPNDVTVSETEKFMASNAYFNILYVMGIERDTLGLDYADGDKFIIDVETYPYSMEDDFQFQTRADGALNENEERELFNKVNVYPNPLYGFNVATSYTNSPSDEPFVTFSNLPEEITVRIYSLSGQLLRTLTQADKSSLSSPFLRWDLQNESGLRVASGLYLAIVSSPKFGDKVLKFTIIMPEKQIQKF